ncbi:hypothetical protein ACQ4PT_023912 [Festuca glaucescens]
MVTTDEDPAGHQSQGPHYISTLRDRKFRVRPPNNPIDDDPPPDSIVLDTKAYLDDRTNSYTADGHTAAGHPIKVTFWIARPPLVSYFTVHFPGLPTPALAKLPRVLCTDGDLVLLRVAICPRHLLSLPQYNDYIIYRAGFRKLQVLPPHPTRLFSDLEVGLLRCRGNDNNDDSFFFFVAALSSAFRRGNYELDLFDSRTCTWSTKPMGVKSSQKQSYSFSCPTKVIAIGGERGSVAWVDLCQGILICDLLTSDDDDTLRYIRLPLLLATNKMRRGASCDRDIAISSNGNIKYVEMCIHAQPGSCVAFGSTYISQDWEAAAWTWMDSDKSWHMDFRLKASETLVDKSHYELLPSLIHRDEDTETMPLLSRLHTGHPALSLHDDDVVYIMAKVDHRDQKAWMLAFDMRNNTVRAVADFKSGRTASGFRFTYLQSQISKHLANK